MLAGDRKCEPSFGEYRPPHPMGMKGGCSPQNALRVEQSFRCCNINLVNSLGTAHVLFGRAGLHLIALRMAGRAGS
jgi:hypothetical protein